MQTSQDPAQGASQQTPSAHEPERHSSAALQESPLPDCSWHSPPLQNAPVGHCESEAQLVGHTPSVPSQVKGAQLLTVPAGSGVQVPAEPAWAQDWHAPEQAVVQHTPDAQTPLWH